MRIPLHAALAAAIASAVAPVCRADYTPEVRFTLLNPEEPGSSILAIGKGTVPKFVIEEFTDVDNARMISIARDLFRILDRVTRHERSTS